uniref:C-type lectin domain-containing protein n=1 Tax=Haplochromis burtoni TaxID=8153 RepID=A0A3Q2VZZ3_HAPBU
FCSSFLLSIYTMRENVALLLILFPVCAHLLDFTYYTDSYKRNWASAQAFCRKHRTDLVQIRNAKESEVFQGFGWIGLYREDASSPWKWSRGGEIAIFTINGKRCFCCFLGWLHTTLCPVDGLWIGLTEETKVCILT